MNYYNQLIDKALELRDYDWVKELVKLRDEENIIIKSNKNKIEYPTLKALENLNDVYVVKEKHGLRNIIMSSQDDIMNSEIVELKECEYKDGIYAKQNSEVKYQSFDEGTQIVIKYYILGQTVGVNLGYNLGKEANLSLFKPNKIILDNLKKYGINM